MELEFSRWFDDVALDDDGNTTPSADFEFCKLPLASSRIVCCFKNDHKKFFKELNTVLTWVVGKKSSPTLTIAQLSTNCCPTVDSQVTDRLLTCYQQNILNVGKT